MDAVISRWGSSGDVRELFAQASLVVHHGGIGGAAYALAAGIPQIAMPMRGDQFDNGPRLQRLGVAQMLALARTTPAVLARGIDALTSSSAVDRRCRHWQARTHPSTALQLAAEAIGGCPACDPRSVVLRQKASLRKTFPLGRLGQRALRRVVWPEA
jgi:UDP:flavonoid glycosyltransferase YjiC (YdhE family)